MCVGDAVRCAFDAPWQHRTADQTANTAAEKAFPVSLGIVLTTSGFGRKYVGRQKKSPLSKKQTRIKKISVVEQSVLICVRICREVVGKLGNRLVTMQYSENDQEPQEN